MTRADLHPFQFGFGLAETPPPPSVRVRIETETSAAKNDLLLLEKDKPSNLHVKAIDCTWAVVRYALELETRRAGISSPLGTLDEPIPVAEIAGSSLEAEVGALLRDPPGSPRIWRFIWLNGAL